jgi:hypothetical protein
MKAPLLFEMVEMIQGREVGKEYFSDSKFDSGPVLQQNCKPYLFTSCAFGSEPYIYLIMDCSMVNT